MKYSSETNRILMTMYKTGGINKILIPTHELRRLFQNDHITNSSDFHDNNIYLTDKGRAYVEELKDSKRKEIIGIVHDCINTLIALVALIVAILAYIKQ